VSLGFGPQRFENSGALADGIKAVKPDSGTRRPCSENVGDDNDENAKGYDYADAEYENTERQSRIVVNERQDNSGNQNGHHKKHVCKHAFLPIA
jgi:hypothetical protein